MMDGGLCFHASTRVAASAGDLFEFHADPHNLPKVMPPTLKLVSLKTDGPAQEGRLIELHCREGWLLPLHLTCRWKVVERPRVLVDEMVRGPFAVFVHEHRFEEDGQDACIMHDTVTFLLGRSWLLRLISATLVTPYLSLLFQYRHHRTRQWAAQRQDAA
jgi:ligand-binding SRPBCC domain-containing protein